MGCPEFSASVANTTPVQDLATGDDNHMQSMKANALGVTLT